MGISHFPVFLTYKKVGNENPQLKSGASCVADDSVFKKIGEYYVDIPAGKHKIIVSVSG